MKTKVFGKKKGTGNAYDLSQLGMGYNQPCPKCGLEIDRRSSPYEAQGFKKYCKCNKK